MRMLPFLWRRIIFLFLIISVVPLCLFGQISIPLDNDFGDNGQAIFPIGPVEVNNAQDKGKQIAQQSDGKIILAGYSHDIGGTEDWIITVIRLEADGTLDPSFGIDGIAKIDFNNGDDESWAVEIQEDDKIVLTGRIWINSNSKMGLARLTANGQLDETFGNNGKVLYEIGSQSDEGFDLAIQPDGKIIATGRSWQVNGETGWGAMRLLPNGQLDSTFNNIGFIYYNSGHFDEISTCVAIQEDGKILFGGSVFGNPAIIRLMPDGSFDSSFNFGGVRTIPIGGQTTSIAIDENQRIVYTAFRYGGICKTGRILPNGEIDLSFGNNGLTTFNTEQTSFYRSYDQVLLLPDGNILGLGTFTTDDPFDNDQTLTLLLMDENGSILDSYRSNPDFNIFLCQFGIWTLHATMLQDGNIGLTSSNCYSGSNLDMLAVKLKYNPTSTSFDLLPLNSDISVFPNLSTGQIQVEHLAPYQSENLQLYDAFGRLCLSQRINQSIMTLELPEASGAYFLKVGEIVKKVWKINSGE